MKAGARETVRAQQARDVSLDFARGIAVILMVLGHSVQYGSGAAFYESEAFFDSILFKVIYSFHMPLFALLSGWAFRWSLKRSFPSLIWKRACSLLLPVLGWSVVFQVFNACLYALDGEMTTAFNWLDGMLSRTFYFGLLDNHWFLWAMFWTSLAVILVEKLLGGKKWLYAVLIVATLAGPAKADLYSYMLPYFIVGCTSPAVIEGWNEKQQRVAMLCCLAVFIVLIPWFSIDSYIYISGLTLQGSDRPLWQVGVDLYRWAIGMAGALVIFLAVRCWNVNRYKDTWWLRAVNAVGRDSLGMYALNGVVWVRILLDLTKDAQPGLLLWIGETAAFLIFAAGVLALLKKIPFVRTVLLGGR